MAKGKKRIGLVFDNRLKEHVSKIRKQFKDGGIEKTTATFTLVVEGEGDGLIPIVKCRLEYDDPIWGTILTAVDFLGEYLLIESVEDIDSA